MEVVDKIFLDWLIAGGVEFHKISWPSTETVSFLFSILSSTHSSILSIIMNTIKRFLASGEPLLWKI